MTADASSSLTFTQLVGEDEAECDLVRGWLREHNWRVNAAFMEKLSQPDHESRPLILIANHGGKVVGGLIAATQLKWLKIGILAVEPRQRSQGIGARLLAAAETEALGRGCAYSYVDTMEYQAPRFYEQRGYEMVGRIADWDSHGHAKLNLRKELVAVSGC